MTTGTGSDVGGTGDDGREVWRVRLRYGGCPAGPGRGRSATARWVEEVLPQEGALPPVATVDTSAGVLVVLHVRSRGSRDAVVAAADVVERVVGDAPRVLGLLLGAGAVRPRARGGPAPGKRVP